MTYQIRVNARAADGTKLGAVYLPHEPTDAEKIAHIAEDIAVNGWQGRPVILADAGDHHIALTGTHRLVACIGRDDVIDAVYLPDDLTSDDFGLIQGAHDDDDMLAALAEIAGNRDDMADVVEAMRAEVAANHAAS